MGDDERNSGTASSIDSRSSSSSSSSSSSLSSSSSSTSSASSAGDWISESDGYRTLDEKEIEAYETWKMGKKDRARAAEQQLLRYEEEQRIRQEMSAGKSSDDETSSEPTSSESAKTSRKGSDKRQRTRSDSDTSGPFELDSGYGLSDSDREHGRVSKHIPVR